MGKRNINVIKDSVFRVVKKWKIYIVQMKEDGPLLRFARVTNKLRSRQKIYHSNYLIQLKHVLLCLLSPLVKKFCYMGTVLATELCIITNAVQVIFELVHQRFYVKLMVCGLPNNHIAKVRHLQKFV